MYPGLQGRVALVTGASRGIGRATAYILAQNGCDIIANYSTSSDKVKELQKDIKELGRDVAVIQANVSLPQDVIRLKKESFDAFPRVDIIVNNAGIHQHLKSWEMTYQDWQTILAVNLTGTFLCSTAFIPHLKEMKFGRIINISSVVAHSGTDHECHYASSKAGILGLTKSLALELAPYHITVNAVAPGYIDTDMTRIATEEEKHKMERLIPLGRLGKPEEVAYGICFLASSNANYVTGETLNINGGVFLP